VPILNVKPLLILIFLFSFLLGVGISGANVGPSSDFVVLIENGGSLGFQNRVDRTVFLNVTSGSLNSSYAQVSMYSGGGYFVFRGNNSVSLSVNPENVAVITEINDTVVEWGSGISLTSSDTFLLRWSVTIEPWIPYLFILGMIGLGSMFCGTLYTVHLFKKGEYKWALVQGVTFISVGFGLFIAWVFA